VSLPVRQLFNTIVWASGGGVDDRQLVDYVGELCDHYGCELRIVHVVPTILTEPMPQCDLHEGEERAIAWLKARTRALRLQGVDASLHVTRGVVGSAAPAIVEVAEAVDADLLVVHAHAGRPIGSIGTAARLLATSPCPVLVLGTEFKPPHALTAPPQAHTHRIEEQMVDRNTYDTAAERGRRFEVLIAGGGVAGLEAAFALQQLAADRVRVRVISVGTDFVYRPLAIGEPFNRSHAAHTPLAELVQEAGAELISDALVGVDADARRAQLASGAELDYDALLVATGAIIDPVHEHVTGIDDARMDQLLHGLVQDIEEGYLHRLAVIIPSPPAWPLPAYELALMASERAWEMQVDLEVTLVTPERVPLDLFGPVASGALTTLLGERRIDLITSAWCEVPRSRSVLIHPDGRELAFDRIVALPALRGPDLSGLPRGGGGFLPVDE
jgi:nucleotide-binding universal stress UspA family protein